MANCSLSGNRKSMLLLPPREMSSTSQKHHNFASEPVGEKPVTALARIVETLHGELPECR